MPGINRRKSLGQAEAIFKRAFSIPQDPRSDAYKRGVKAALVFRFAGDKIVDPFEAGTAESDAFHAGLSEGHAVGGTWQCQHQERRGDHRDADEREEIFRSEFGIRVWFPKREPNNGEMKLGGRFRGRTLV